MTQVVAALIERDGKLLVCRRPPDKARGLLWEFAGGKVEAGETKEEALMRECREELGCELAVGSVYAVIRHDYPDLSIELTLFRARVAAGEPRALEHSELRWAFPEELPALDFCPADREIVQAIARTWKTP